MEGVEGRVCLTLVESVSGVFPEHIRTGLVVALATGLVARLVKCFSCMTGGRLRYVIHVAHKQQRLACGEGEERKTDEEQLEWNRWRCTQNLDIKETRWMA